MDGAVGWLGGAMRCRRDGEERCGGEGNDSLERAVHEM
jgi:hypothetical protein